MKKCILCGKEHEGGCDKSEWDGVLKQKFSVPESIRQVTGKISYIAHDDLVKLEHELEGKALKEDERQHVAKRRGRKPHKSI